MASKQSVQLIARGHWGRRQHHAPGGCVDPVTVVVVVAVHVEAVVWFHLVRVGRRRGRIGFLA